MIHSPHEMTTTTYQTMTRFYDDRFPDLSIVQTRLGNKVEYSLFKGDKRIDEIKFSTNDKLGFDQIKAFFHGMAAMHTIKTPHKIQMVKPEKPKKGKGRKGVRNASNPAEDGYSANSFSIGSLIEDLPF